VISQISKRSKKLLVTILQIVNLLFFMAIDIGSSATIMLRHAHSRKRAENAEENAEKLRYLTNAASEYAQTGQWSRSTEIVETLKSGVSGNPDLQYELLSALRELAGAEKNDELQLAIMERMMSYVPAIRRRVFTGFQASEIGNSDMAFHHYLKIPIFWSEMRPTWNNIGVAYGEFGMPIKL